MFLHKTIQILILAVIPVIGFSGTPDSTRPKIGLVLSGGGALGFSHIGLLKMLDSLRIPIDYVAGTSMGGLMGALYSMGYSGDDIEQMAATVQWDEVFSDRPAREVLPYVEKKDLSKYQFAFDLEGLSPTTPTGLIQGQKVLLLLSRWLYTTGYDQDFNRMPIPFRCVSVDLVTGTPVIHSSGSLVMAMRATMSVPTIFAPVEWGDSMLVDGGLLNNLPADVVRDMGADIVIGVNLGAKLLPKEQLNSFGAIVGQSMNIPLNIPQEKSLELVDYLLVPDLSSFTPVDFTSEKIRQIIDAGLRDARSFVPVLNKLKAIYKLEADRAGILQASGDSILISQVTITSSGAVNDSILLSQFLFPPDQPVPEMEIRNRINRLRMTFNYDRLDYQLLAESDKTYRLTLKVTAREQPFIRNILVTGNTRVPEDLIREFIGIRSGDRVDPNAIEDHINQLYSLSYFKTIFYEIIPVKGRQEVDIIIQVREAPFNKLRVGLRYDNPYRLVGLIGLTSTNWLIEGVRTETNFWFAGLTSLDHKVYYPSRALDQPAYPFVHFNYKNLPATIFDADGTGLASYQDRSWSLGGGLGFLMRNSGSIELGYYYEWVKTEPSIAAPIDSLFPVFNEDLPQIRGRINLDLLDRDFFPTKGILFEAGAEGSFPLFGSQRDYFKVFGELTTYVPVTSLQTFRFYTFYGFASEYTPVYKYFRKSGPDGYAGLEFNHLIGKEFGIIRGDYRVQVADRTYLNVIGNMVFNYQFDGIQMKTSRPPLYGAGGAIQFDSLLGPIEFMLIWSESHLTKKEPHQVIGYFTAGYRL